MLCPNCGNDTPDQGKFCINCGADLGLLAGRDEMQDEDGVDKNSIIDNSKLIKTCSYIEINNNMLEISLLDREAVDHFKKNYFHNGTFNFPLGRYTVSYNEDVITNINTVAYFTYVREDTVWRCEENYKKEVRDWESFFNSITRIYQDCIDRIASLTLDLMVASGIMSYTEDFIEEGLLLGSNSAFAQAMQSCAVQYDNIMSEYAAAEDRREMDRMISSSSKYVGGGFGLRGILGGMAAAGMANAGSSLANGIKNGMSKSSNRSKMRNELNKVAKDPSVLECMLADIRECTRNAVLIYREACEREIHFRFEGYSDEKMSILGDNTISYIENREKILENLSKVLAAFPKKKGVLDFLAECFYNNKEISIQLLKLSEFLLYKEEMASYLTKLKEDDLRDIYNLPEDTIADISEKLNQLVEKGRLLSYDVSEHTKRLEELLDKKKKEEEARKKHQDAIERTMKKCLESAEKADTALKNNDMETLGVLSAAGDMVAEERYIQYYISKIRDADDNHLFDAIADQCGSNRANDCIIGICCYNGYGSMKDTETAKKLLLNSAELGCTYAMGYMSHLLNAGKAGFLGEDTVKKYHDIALEKMSPYACMWEGKLFCQGTAEGGSNKIPNDFEKALNYIEFAHKCGIAEAGNVFNYLMVHSAEEINAKKYTSDSGCYITTAVCNSFGKPDDCCELTAFRNFRDSYLLSESEGRHLVERYYRIAPKIVQNIDALPERDCIYYEIWEKYLKKCMSSIQNNEPESCKNTYVEMVSQLERKFL